MDGKGGNPIRAAAHEGKKGFKQRKQSFVPGRPEWKAVNPTMQPSS